MNLTDDDKAVLSAYADARMRVRGTAKQTYFSEQAIHARLSKIYRKTKLDPREFRDLAALLRSYEGGEQDDPG